ncbi:MAG: hypothetical protein ACRESV_04865 [Nevskiales bacterium]
MSKQFFLFSIGGTIAASHVLLVVGMLRSKYELSALVPLSIVPTASAGILLAILAYKAWSTIQDGHARMAPSSAILRLFIPIYNVYWYFQVFWGFAKDYNDYLDRHDLDASKISDGIFLMFTVWNLAVWGIGFLFLGAHYSLLLAGGGFLLELILGTAHTVLGVLVVINTCDAINTLAALPGRPAR